MKKVANFYKVTFEQFANDWKETFNGSENHILTDEDNMRNIYKCIKLPERSTAGSAGYDFVSPIGFTLEPGEDIKIPTGICAEIKEGWVLMLFPRSGLGFKYGLKLLNTIGVVDQDYFFSYNEGHIFIKIRNEGDLPMTINTGDKIVQGVFLPYGITREDDAKETRNGGFGSTGR